MTWMDFWIFLHFLSEKGLPWMDEMGLPILPQLPGGEAVALGAGNKRRSFILFLGGTGAVFMGFIRVLCGGFIWSRLFWAG